MDINKQLLETRLTIIMVRESYTFVDKISNFQRQLKSYFNVDYNLDEIENSLKDLEEAYLFHEDELQKQNTIEYEEDF